MTDEPPVPFDDLLLLVGKLNYSWTNTESLLIHLIAGLSGTDKETAVVIFLTLSSSRARIELVERLSKLDRVPGSTRERIVGLTSRLGRLSGLRNRYSHCIYSFDGHSGAARTILMRIADRKDSIKVGQMTDIDRSAIGEIEEAISELGNLNLAFWKAIRDLGFPA